MITLLVGTILTLIIIYIYCYNSLASSLQNVGEGWSDIDVQLRRRQNLIPNLVEVVKGYEKHEKSLFEHIAQTRSKAIQITREDIAQKSALEWELENSLHQMLSISENYPALKANENFQKLQHELVNTEDQIASSRRIYNSNVADYNTKVMIFPINIVAKFNHFAVAKFFQSE